jgi:predicted RNA-binding protein with EMAP domain
MDVEYMKLLIEKKTIEKKLKVLEKAKKLLQQGKEEEFYNLLAEHEDVLQDLVYSFLKKHPNKSITKDGKFRDIFYIV